MTNPMVSLGLAALLCTRTAAAQAPEPAAAPSAVTPLERALAAAEAARAAAVATEEASAGALALLGADAADLEALLAAASGLVDPRAPADGRASAAARLAQSGRAEALAALLGAAHHRDPAIRTAALSGLAVSIDPGAAAALGGLLEARWGGADLDLQVAAARALGDRGDPASGDVLYTAADAGGLPGPVQRAAVEALAAHFAPLLATRGRPAGRSDVGSAALVAASSAAAGGVVLSGVGVWSQSDAAVAIGAIGGAGIGAGLGGVWARSEPFTRGGALRYSSDTLWGIAGGSLAGPLLLGAVDGRAHGDLSAALRVVGTSAGVASGATQARRGDPDPHDVLEQDLAGLLGVQTGLGLVRVVGSREELRPWGYTTTTPSDAALAGGALAGAAVGLGGAALLRDPWTPSGADLALATVVSAETTVIVASSHVVAGKRYRDGTAQLGMGLGALGGLAMAEALDPTPRQVAMSAWGAVLGNALGAGVPLLVPGASEPAVVGTLLPVGLAGAVGGGLMADHLPIEDGDPALMGFAVPLAALEGLTVGLWAAERSPSFTGGQVGGLVLTASSVTGVALTGLAPHIDPDPGDVGMVASITAWGAYHGAVVPLALDTRGTAADLAFVSTLTADGFLVLGSVLASPAVDLAPRRTLIPQLGGVTGATLGSMGALLVSTERAAAARGALIGSTAGFLVGGVIEARRPPAKAGARRGARAMRLPDLPGDWGVTAAPMPTQSGTPGLYAELRAVGW